MKKITAVILAALCIFALAGCADSGSKDVDLKAVLAKINTDYKLSDMQQIADAKELSEYYLIDSKDIASFAAQINKDGLNEIVLVKATDADAAKRVEAKLNERYKSRSNEIASYSPENYAIIKTCEVAVEGNYVRMIIAKDADGMVDVYNSFFK